MIEKGSINWASVFTSRAEHKPSTVQTDRRGVEKSTANWSDDLQGKVAAEVRSLAPGENDGSEKPTHRGDERRRRAESERRNSGSTARRSGDNSATGGHERTWDKAPQGREQNLNGLPQRIKRNLKVAPVRRKKTAPAKSASKIKTSWPDLKCFVSDTFPTGVFSLAMAEHYPLKVARPTALNPLGGGFVWTADLFPSFEDRVVR